MRRQALLAVALLLAVRVSAADDFKTATPEELAMKDAAIAPGAAAVVLDWNRRRDDGNDFYSSEYLRIKILKDAGKKLADVEMPYIPGYSRVDHIYARQTKPDGTIVPFNGRIYDKTIVKVGGVRIAAKTFTIPDVQPGSIIEYRYNESSKLANDRYLMQRDEPVLHETLWLRPYGRAVSSFFTYQGLPVAVKPEYVKDHYELDLHDVPPYEPEPYSKPASWLKAQLGFHYSLIGLDTAAFWSRQDAIWTEEIEGFIGDRTGIRKAAQDLTAAATAPDDRLRKIYARVQQVRNLSFEPEKTEQETKKLRDNNNVEDVLRNGYGWRDEVTRLFVALARGAGFEANIVRIGDRGESFLEKKSPVASQLNNEIAMVMIDGLPRLFDPSTPLAPYGVLSWEKTYTSGLKIAKKAGAAWIDISEDSAESAVVKRVATLRFDGDALKGKAVITRGGHAALAKKLEFLNDDESAVKKSLEESAKSWFADGSTVKLTRVAGLRAAEEPLVEEYEVELPTTGSIVGSRVLLPMAIFSASQKTLFPSEKRQHDIYFEYERRSEDEVTLELPAGYAVESLPKTKSVDLRAVSFNTRYDRGATNVRFTRELKIAAVVISRNAYEPVRKFFNDVASSDQDSLVLRKGAN